MKEISGYKSYVIIPNNLIKNIISKLIENLLYWKSNFMKHQKPISNYIMYKIK